MRKLVVSENITLGRGRRLFEGSRLMLIIVAGLAAFGVAAAVLRYLSSRTTQGSPSTRLPPGPTWYSVRST